VDTIDPPAAFAGAEVAVAACGFFAPVLSDPPCPKKNTKMASATKIPAKIESVLFIKPAMRITNGLLAAKPCFVTLSS